MEMSPARLKLRDLEEGGDFVFHGAGERMETLEPKQAYVDKEGKKVPDGPPAVFASSNADYAIFMAIVNERNCPKGYRSGVGRNHTPEGALSMDFRIDPEGFAQLTDAAEGWVHVLKKDDFTLRKEGDVEYIAGREVSPVYVFAVHREDLPENIRISTE